jgi:hypothetical protein
MAELTRISVAAEIGAADPAAEAPGVTVRLIDPGALWLVSDNLPDLAPNALRGGAPYWLWLAPDRALRVGAGERPGGFASDVTDGFATFEIAGARAAEIIARRSRPDAARRPCSPASGQCCMRMIRRRPSACTRNGRSRPICTNGSSRLRARCDRARRPANRKETS